MKTFFTFALLFLPISLRAQVTLNSILEEMTSIIEVFIPVAIAIAVVVFIWGLVRMIAGMSYGDSDTAIAEGKKRMIWGVVGLFLIVSIWGIVELLIVMFGADVGNQVSPPQINTFMY